MKEKISIFWFRRDLRLDDNVGLFEALNGVHKVLPIFIFDKDILDGLPREDARVTFIYQNLQRLRSILQKQFNSSIALFNGKPVEVFKALMDKYILDSAYANHDYEPYAQSRDNDIRALLDTHGIPFKTFKDQVIFEKNEVVKEDRNPYVVFTPYKNKWKERFDADKNLRHHDSFANLGNLMPQADLPNVTLEELGFAPSKIMVPDFALTPALIDNYENTRNFPAKHQGTSRLGPHLRFGTVSIRKTVRKAIEGTNEVFWSELIWREFFMQILWHFPKTVNTSFKPKYDRIEWRNNVSEFELWKQGKTGYTLVDAGMRELNQTGYMHNRVRMLVASFLCKHLLIDWRWGEAYFAEKLLDYELSSNVGNWQWAAGSGVDAAPYFRIFNPMAQVDKFDKDHEYIHRWIPELQEFGYPDKMVDHKMARERCLEVYKSAVG